MYQQRCVCFYSLTARASDATAAERSNMSDQAMVEEISGPERLVADFKVPSGNAFGSPQQRQYPPSELFDNRPTAVYAGRRF